MILTTPRGCQWLGGFVDIATTVSPVGTIPGRSRRMGIYHRASRNGAPYTTSAACNSSRSARDPRPSRQQFRFIACAATVCAVGLSTTGLCARACQRRVKCIPTPLDLNGAGRDIARHSLGIMCSRGCASG
ncbi:hypothetical protein KCP78_10435 [Salmonella enterica subsp. enterica]|nr:hypothetical protein KCP78_10435 [Salmonella enterica subsp. enterica]